MPLITTLNKENNSAITSIQTLNTPSDSGFRHIVRFSVPATDRLSFDPTTTKLTIRFSTYEYNAVTAPSALKATRISSGNFVIVRLPAPRRIAYFDLASSNSNTRLKVHRVDGNVVAEQATLTNLVPGQQSSAMGFIEFVSFASGGQNNTILAGEGLLGGGNVEGNVDFMFLPGVLMAGDKPFMDVNFAVGRDDTNAKLNTGDLNDVRIHSVPTGLRLSVTPFGDYSNPFVFWQGPGEHTNGVTATVGQALAETLARLLDTFDNPPQEFAILIESGAECQYTIQEVSIQPRGVLDNFGGEPKVVLKPDGSSKLQSARFSLPSSPTVARATVRVVDSLQGVNPVGSDTQPIENYRYGIRLASGDSVAMRINMADAIRLQELRVGLLSLSYKSLVHVALQTDHEGLPSGNILAETAVKPDTIALPAWTVVRLSETITVSTATYWLVLTAQDGEVVWLADQVTDVSDVLRLEKIPNDGVWTAQNAVENLAPAMSLATPAMATSGGTTLALSIDGTSLNSVPVIDDSGAVIAHDYDLLPSLAGAGGDVAIQVRSYAKGIVTLKDLRVEYDI